MIEGTFNRVAWQMPSSRDEKAAMANFAREMGSGIFGQFFSPLSTGPFAFHQMALNYLVQAGMTANAHDGGQFFLPEPEAEWTASLTGEHTGDIDLGDGYTLQLDERNSEITIKNAATGETTRIWGDPHVDVDGERAFDFWGTTTFTLENGTKVTIDTEQWGKNPDAYVASKVTITNEDRAIVVQGISQNELGDLSVSMSQNGEAIDAATRDGFVLHENATGSSWRSELTGGVATQADLNATRPGALYGPGSTMPSFGEIQAALRSFLLFGFAVGLGEAVAEVGLVGRGQVRELPLLA